MTLKRQAFVGLALGLSAVVAHADPWQGKGEAGVVATSGNTNSDSYNFKLGLTKVEDLWKHALDMSYLRASSGSPSVTTANRFIGSWQSNYNFTTRAFAFGGLRYEHDEFSGFDYQASASAGVGYKFYDTDTVKFSGQAGAGYRRIKDNVTDQTSGNAIFVGGLNYEYTITPTTKLADKFTVESGSDNTLLTNFVGLEVKMSDKLGLAVGYDVHNNSKPPPGKKKTDTTTTLNLVFAF
jgi:putative salt-induced outer membrane protein